MGRLDRWSAIRTSHRNFNKKVVAVRVGFFFLSFFLKVELECFTIANNRKFQFWRGEVLDAV